MDDGTRSHSVLATVKSFVTEFLGDKPFQLAAALSYFTLLSMVPLFLLLTGVAGLVFGREAAREQ
jgi:membrane protein